MYLQYKKQSNKDPAMPKELEERRARCMEWMHHPSPTASPHASDEENEGDEFAVSADVTDGVAGLLGLASDSLDGLYADTDKGVDADGGMQVAGI